MPSQRQAAQVTPLDEPVVVIESETGSGKTEGALWRFARSRSSMALMKTLTSRR